jgi:hypothetical protein
MRTPSILIALALSAAGAAQSFVREEGPVIVTASFDAARTCGHVGVGLETMAAPGQEGESAKRAARLCLDVEAARRLAEERRLRLLPMTRWISTTAGRIAAKIEDL